MEWLNRPTSIGITAPVTGGIPDKKTIYWMQCASPSCVKLTSYLQAAVDAVGWELKVIDVGFTAETVKAGWEQAVQGEPDAVITSGFSRALYEPELQELAKRDIPVLNMTTAEPPGDGITAAQNYDEDFTRAGERLGEYVVSESGDDINAVNMTVSAFQNLTKVADGFTTTIKDACPDCNVDTLDLPVTSLGGDLPTRVASYLQAHPDVNWVYIGYADMMVGVPAALEAAGIDRDVKFVTIDSLPTTAEYMANGDYLVAADGSPKPEMMWRHIDYLLRYFNGEDTAPATEHTLPTWVLTADTLPSTTDDFPLVEDYESQYKALWGVS